MPNHEETPVFRTINDPLFTQEDLEQEVALRKLEGVEFPNRSLIMKELNYGKSGRALTYEELPEFVSFESAFSDGTPDGLDIGETERLINWALEHDILDKVDEFLESPTEEMLEELMSFLVELGLVDEPPKPNFSIKRKHQTPALILKNLPATKEELYEMARTILTTTARPEATIRQALRRMTKQNRIKLEDGQYVTG